MPFMQISYQQKAPAFANIDNVKEKLEKHFGRIYENASDFIRLLTEEEEMFAPPGTKL